MSYLEAVVRGDEPADGLRIAAAKAVAGHGKISRMARPHGPIRHALLQAAACGPGTAVQLAHRSLVSVSCARYTCTRLVAQGELTILTPGRPAVLARRPAAACAEDAAPGADLAAALAGWR